MNYKIKKNKNKLNLLYKKCYKELRKQRRRRWKEEYSLYFNEFEIKLKKKLNKIILTKFDRKL